MKHKPIKHKPWYATAKYKTVSPIKHKISIEFLSLLDHETLIRVEDHLARELQDLGIRGYLYGITSLNSIKFGGEK